MSLLAAFPIGDLAKSLVRMVVWLVLLTVIFVPLERLLSERPARIWRKQVGVDLIWYFINSLFPAILLSIPLAILVKMIGMINPGGLFTFTGGWPLWLKFLAALFVNDLGAYWGHRLSHKLPILWRFHEVHHSAEHLDWLVNTRAHPVDMVFTRLCGLAPVYLLGLTQLNGAPGDQLVPLVTALGVFWSFFIHANVRLRFGFIEWIVSTPAFHHWHHTRDEHKDKNFAALFPVIDWIFGTSWLPKNAPSAYGVSRKTPQTFLGQMFEPLWTRMAPEKQNAPKTGGNEDV